MSSDAPDSTFDGSKKRRVKTNEAINGLSEGEFLLLSAIYDKHPYHVNPSKFKPPVNYDTWVRGMLPRLVSMGYLKVSGEDIIKLKSGCAKWELDKAAYEAKWNTPEPRAREEKINEAPPSDENPEPEKSV